MSDADDERNAFARASNVASREEVREYVENKSFVADTGKCGPGLLVTHERRDNPLCTFTGLVEKRGWYVASYAPRESGDEIVIMPLQEVQQP